MRDAHCKKFSYRLGCVGRDERPGAGASNLEVAVHAGLKDPLVLWLMSQAAAGAHSAAAALVLRTAAG